MRVWLTSFILLFGAAQLYNWAQTLTLPLPIFVLGGAFLAIASNYDKLKNLPIHLEYEEPEPPQKTVTSGSSQPFQTASKARVAQPISFEIQKPFKPGD
jgi:hypothetical protein